MNNRQRFFVHVDTGDGKPVVAGYYQIDASRNAGIFIYGRSYCENPQAFALDPVNLPLIYNERFYIPITRFQPTGIPGALLDSGPDEWGKRIINRLADPKPMTPADYLVMGSGFGVGALYFSDKADPITPPKRDHDDELVSLYYSALALDTDEPDLDQVAHYLMPSSGIGGARPKAPWVLNGRPCIAKFNRKDDPFDNALAEYCMMTLAQEAGIDSAPVHIVKTELGHAIAIERFDIAPAAGNQEPHRRHVLSANAVLNIRDMAELGQTSYDQIAAVGRKIGLAETISEQLFTRMLFNVAIGNTDDHSRNHAFIKHQSNHGYELSPAYDLVPVPYRLGAHAINLGPFGQSVTLDNIIGGARLMRLDKQQQQRSAQAVYTVASNLAERLAELGMPENDIQYLAPCFAQTEKIRILAQA